jgi:hypothetical protein
MLFRLGPQWDTAPLTRELRVDTTHTAGPFSTSAQGTTVTMLFTARPGCDELQLDSAQGTSIIVVNAERAQTTRGGRAQPASLTASARESPRRRIRGPAAALAA